MIFEKKDCSIFSFEFQGVSSLLLVLTPHAGLTVYVVTAGLLMMAGGVFRLMLPKQRNSPYSLQSITVTYSLLIMVGAVLIGLALCRRHFA